MITAHAMAGTTRGPVQSPGRARQRAPELEGAGRPVWAASFLVQARN
jgi:hypothetical protein